MKNKTLLITVVAAVVAIALSVVIGFSVANMKERPEAESRTNEETLPEGSESAAAPESESETSQSPVITPDDEKPYHMQNTWQSPESRMNEILGYSSVSTRYYTKDTLNPQGRPVEAVWQQSYYFKVNAPGTTRILNTSDERITLSFVLTEENGDNTERLLDFLKAFEVKAVFFSGYDYAAANPAIIRRILTDGHALGSLGASVPSDGFSSLGIEDQIRDLKRMHDYIYDTYGYSMKYFHYANKRYSFQSMALVQFAGYEVCFFSADYPDTDPNADLSSSEFLEGLKGKLHNGAIYLLHTSNTTSVLVARNFVEYLKESGRYQAGLYD